MDYKKKITNELIEDILKKGVRNMPQNPGAQGYSERQIRAFYYLPEKETLAVMSEIEDELIKTINGETTVGVAHHLQKKTPLYNAENPIDFNDFLETGEYGFGSNDNMLYVSNSPITQGGTLIVTSCFKPTANKNTVWACRRQEFITCYGVWQRCETVDSYGKHTGWEKWKRFVTDIETVDNAKYAVEAHHFRKVILDENTPINSNEFLECGHYGVNDKLAKSSKNIPDTAGGTLTVSSFFTSHPNTDSKWAYRTQEYFNRNGRWFRSEALKEDGSHNSWTDWKHFVINEDLTEYQKTIDNSLNTESKKIPEAINEVNTNKAPYSYVDEKFNGANKAVAFASYENLVNELLIKPKEAYRIGQNMYIWTLSVPDLWVAGVVESYVPYSYTTDEAFIEEIKNLGGYVQVGYYRLAMLETQKVDLSKYQKIIDDTLETESKEIVGAINELFHKSEFLQFDSLQLMEDEFYHESEPKYGVGTRIRVENIELVITKILSEFDDNPPYPGGDENAINYFIEALNSGKVDYFWYELTAVAPDLSEYVKFTDVATRDKYGLSKAGAGLYNNSGTYMVYPASDSEIENFSSFYGPITTTKIPLAVKAGLTKTNIEWTEEEKASARELLGISGGGSGGGKLYKHMVNITCADNDLAPINSFTFTFISSESRDITQILGYGDTKRTITFNEFASYILVNEVNGEMVEEWSSCIIYSLSGSTTETSLDYPVRYNYKGAIHTAIAYAMDDTVTEV